MSVHGGERPEKKGQILPHIAISDIGILLDVASCWIQWHPVGSSLGVLVPNGNIQLYPRPSRARILLPSSKAVVLEDLRKVSTVTW